MKKLFSILLLISIVLTAFSGVGVLAAKKDEPEVQIASFAANGSFEKLTADGKPDKWNLSSVTKMGEHVEISDKAKDGEHSIYMKGETGASSGKMVSQLISGLMPGSKYKVTFYARIDAVTGVKTGTVDIYFRDSAGATIKYDGGNGERIGFTSIDKKWHKYEHEMIAPERTVGAQLCVRMYDGTVGYVDNIEFTGEVAPQICEVLDPLPGEENMLKNSSLEEIGDDGKPVNWKINAVDKVKVVDDPQQGKVLRYESADASHPWASQEVAADFEVGATYQVSAMLKTEYVPSLGTNKGPSFKLEFYDANRTPMYEKYATDFQLTSGLWQKVAMQFVMPEGTKYINIYPRLYSHGIIYYDDIEFHKVKDIPPFTMDSKSMLYTDWKQGNVQLTANHLAAGDSYDVKIKYGEEIVFEEKVPAQEYLEYVFSLALLENKGKEYTLEVSYVDGDGNVLQTETDDMYRFDRPTALTTDGQCIDGNGEIFYPVLGYHVLYEDFEMVEKLGINLLRSGDNKDKTMRAGVMESWRENTKKWLDDAWYNHGMMTMICLYGGGGTFGTEEYYQNAIKFIEDLGDHPGLYGYLVQDEPYNDWHEPRVDQQLKEIYCKIREVDSENVIVHVSNREKAWEESTDWADIVILDRYPTTALFENLQYNFIKHAQKTSEYKKPVWTLYQTSQMSSSFVRTDEKHRNMVYQGLFAGADSNGFIAVSEIDSKGTGVWTKPEIGEAITEMAQGELADAVKAFLTGEYPTFCENSGDPDLPHWGYYLRTKTPDDYWYKAYVKNGELYMVVLNNRDAETPVSIPLTSYDGSVVIGDFTATVVDKVSPAQTVTGNGVLEAVIEPFGATLFKITANADYSGLKATKYDDLQGFEWARNAIANAYDNGIVNDIGLQKYAPEKNITRADFAGYLIRTLGLTADATDTFADVDDSYYYAKEIAIGKALGILNGVGDNKYEPDAPISRQDLMVICTRGMKIVKEMNLDTSKLNAFSDAGLIADYAREGITGMVTEGIVKGNTDGTINPLGNTTRAEAAVIMDRILNWK